MAMRIVEAFEVIDIDHDHSKRLIPAAHAGHVTHESVLQVPPVEQSRQPVSPKRLVPKRPCNRRLASASDSCSAIVWIVCCSIWEKP